MEDGRPFTIASTGSLATALDERQYERGDGPCLRCIEAGERLLVTDMHTERRWSDWARSASSAGAGSSLSIPLALHGGTSAALNLYSTERDAFDATSVELASTFAAYAVVGRVHLYTAQRQVADQLQTVMQSQAVIEQAKGILIGQRQCSPEEAFGILVRRGEDSNRTLRDMAEVLVSEARSRNR